MKAAIRFIILLIAVSGASSAQANQPDEQQQPITISAVSISKAAAGKPSKLSFYLTNRSSKVIDAYALRVGILDASGRPVSHLARAAAKKLLPASDQKGHAPDETWEGHFDLPLVLRQNISVADVKISVDYIFFDDGSTWGPDIARQSVRIAGMREGALMERDRLRKLLKRAGIDAVRADLNRSNPK